MENVDPESRKKHYDRAARAIGQFKNYRDLIINKGGSFDILMAYLTLKGSIEAMEKEMVDLIKKDIIVRSHTPLEPNSHHDGNIHLTEIYRVMKDIESAKKLYNLLAESEDVKKLVNN